jgi:hypothetical protein
MKKTLSNRNEYSNAVSNNGTGPSPLISLPWLIFAGGIPVSGGTNFYDGTLYPGTYGDIGTYSFAVHSYSQFQIDSWVACGAVDIWAVGPPGGNFFVTHYKQSGYIGTPPNPAGAGWTPVGGDAYTFTSNNINNPVTISQGNYWRKLIIGNLGPYNFTPWVVYVKFY